MHRRTRRSSRPACVLLMVGALAACGYGDTAPLADTDRAVAALDAGRIDLTLAATTTADANAAKPVGFRIQGPFAIEQGRDYPTLDLRYTTLLGTDERVTRVVSDGHTVHVIHDGVRTEVPPRESQGLRLGSGKGGFTDLGLAGWVENPVVVDRPDDTRLVTGTVDVADLLSDLARISGQVAGAGDAEELAGDAARRVRRLVRHSEFTAEVDRAGLPRNLRAVVEFGGDLPPELRAALGPYASPRLEVTLSVGPAEQ